LLGGVGLSAPGGAKSGVSGIASGAGRALRTGATADEQSAAARVLPKAGGLAKDLDPIARGTLVAGVVLDVGTSVAEGKTAGDTVGHAAASTGLAVGAGVLVGGACEAGTLGVGSVGCVVIGGAAAAGGAYLGGELADHVLQPVSHGVDDAIHRAGSLIP
jgi:hypothetical protein